MRLFEILLVMADILTFLVVAVPQLYTTRWKGGITLSTCSLAMIQILAEGARWQMVPAYVLAGLFLLM